MKIIPIDNQAKYKRSDIVLIKDRVCIILDVETKKRSDKQLKIIADKIESKRKSMSNRCCAARKPIKEIKLDVYKYTYVTTIGEINEDEIMYSGLDYVNTFISKLKSQIIDYQEKVDAISNILGYNDDY